MYSLQVTEVVHAPGLRTGDTHIPLPSGGSGAQWAGRTVTHRDHLVGGNALVSRQSPGAIKHFQEGPRDGGAGQGGAGKIHLHPNSSDVPTPHNGRSPRGRKNVLFLVTGPRILSRCEDKDTYRFNRKGERGREGGRKESGKGGEISETPWQRAVHLPWPPAHGQTLC